MKQGRINFAPWFVTISVLVLLVMLSFTINDDLKKTEKIGGSIQGVIEAYDEGKQVEFFVQDSARIAAERAMKTLLTNGGLIDINACGVFGDYVKWNEPHQECSENVYEAYSYYLNVQHNNNLNAFNKWSSIMIPLDNIDFYIDNQRIAGVSSNPVRIPISTEADIIETELLGIIIDEQAGVRANVGQYYVKPSFSLEYKSGLDLFGKISTLLTAVTDQCKYLPAQNQTACIQHLVTVSGLPITFTAEPNNYYYFTIQNSAEKPKHVTYTPIRIAYYVPPPIAP